jgi:hypothetical protein
MMDHLQSLFCYSGCMTRYMQTVSPVLYHYICFVDWPVLLWLRITSSLM